LGGQIQGAAGAVVGELAGNQGDAVHSRVVAKPVAGHADLAAAGLEQHCLIEVGPLLDGLDAGGLNPQKRGRRHDDPCMRTPVLARESD